MKFRAIIKAVREKKKSPFSAPNKALPLIGRTVTTSSHQAKKAKKTYA
jgi:hypothetical protein